MVIESVSEKLTTAQEQEQKDAVEKTVSGDSEKQSSDKHVEEQSADNSSTTDASGTKLSDEETPSPEKTMDVSVELKRKVGSGGEESEESSEEPSNKKMKVMDGGEEEEENTGKTTESSLDLSIKRQLEYYFGDINLNYDKFLQDKISKNEEGWVPLELLMKFKRLASICNDMKRIVEALTNNPSSVVQLNEEKTMIRRHPENPAAAFNSDSRMEIRKRTAYAKGFPLDSKLNVLVDFFTKYEGFEHVDMRKYFHKQTRTWKFKGSVYIIFNTVENCTKFLGSSKVSDFYIFCVFFWFIIV